MDDQPLDANISLDLLVRTALHAETVMESAEDPFAGQASMSLFATLLLVEMSCTEEQKARVLPRIVVPSRRRGV